MDGSMSMEYWWNDTDARTEILREKPVPFYHKSQVDWPGTESEPLQ
jgi:hypothetical protein